MALEVDDRKGTTSHFSTPKWTIDIDDDHDGHNLRSSSHYIGTHRLIKLSFAAVLSSRRLLCWQQSRQLCPFFSFLAISLSTSRRPCVDATWSPWLVTRLRSPMKKVSLCLGCRGFNRLVKSRPETKKRRECSQSGGGRDSHHPTINLDATTFWLMIWVRNQRKKIRVYQSTDRIDLGRIGGRIQSNWRHEEWNQKEHQQSTIWRNTTLIDCINLNSV